MPPITYYLFAITNCGFIRIDREKLAKFGEVFRTALWISSNCSCVPSVSITTVYWTSSYPGLIFSSKPKKPLRSSSPEVSISNELILTPLVAAIAT